MTNNRKGKHLCARGLPVSLRTAIESPLGDALCLNFLLLRVFPDVSNPFLHALP